MMKITNPLFIYDLETTGTDLMNSKIVSMSFIFYPQGMSSTERVENTFLVDPDMTIPIEASNVHGITDEMVIGQGLFRHHLDKFLDILMTENLVLCGYNNRSFDDIILERELREAGHEFDFKSYPCLDLLALWRVAEPRTLTGAMKRFLGEDLEGAHDAQEDTKAVKRLIKPFLQTFSATLPEDISQLNSVLFPDENRRLDKLGKVILNDQDKPSLSFGKWRGIDLSVVEKSYLTWFVKQDFPEDTKQIVRKFL